MLDIEVSDRVDSLESFCLKVAPWHVVFPFLENRLKLKAIKFIVKNYKEVSATPGWNSILDHHPRALAAILEYHMNRVEPLKWQKTKTYQLKINIFK